MACFYKKDYDRIGGFGRWIRVNGWGGEDLYLINRFQKLSIEVFRAITPGLFHLYHDKKCEKGKLTKAQYKSCIKVRIRNEGSHFSLGLVHFNYTEFLKSNRK